MKILTALASVVALGAFSLSFFSFEIATSLLVGAGFTAIVLHDYSRTVLSRGKGWSLAAANTQGRERLRLAA